MTISEYPHFYSLTLSSVITYYRDPELVFQAFRLDSQSVVLSRAFDAFNCTFASYGVNLTTSQIS